MGRSSAVGRRASLPLDRIVFWLWVALLFGLLAVAPDMMSRFQLLNLSGFLLNGFLAMGLCLIWGSCGILSLGQGAFLGLGGYAYGIIGINLIEDHGNTILALAGGLAVPVVFAAFLGLVLFYGRLKGVYVAILMLVVALLFESFLNQTAGPGWAIGEAHLGGNNGLGRFSGVMREPPSLSFGLGEERGLEFVGSTRAFFYLVSALLLVTYLALQALVHSRYGLVMRAIRENPERTESLGHDIRLVQLLVFCLGAGLAAISGILYVSWGNFITPDVFGVYNNILPVIWVAVAGRMSLTATLVGTVFLAWLSQRLALEGDYALIVLGSILVLSMMVAPEGILKALGDAVMRGLRALQGRARQGAEGGA